MRLVPAVDGFRAGLGTILYVIFTPSGKHNIFITNKDSKQDIRALIVSPLVVNPPSLKLQLMKTYGNFAGLHLGLGLQHGDEFLLRNFVAEFALLGCLY